MDTVPAPSVAVSAKRYRCEVVALPDVVRFARSWLVANAARERLHARHVLAFSARYGLCVFGAHLVFFRWPKRVIAYSVGALG